MREIHLSIVVPVYKGENMLEELCNRIISNVKLVTEKFEIILVNDASPDNSWNKIELLCLNNFKIKGINLSRNFGQHYAITAGLSNAKGEWIVVMDCDLQDRPEEIPLLYNKAQEGYDIVLAQRIDRHDKFFKKITSSFFYLIFSYLTDTKLDKTIANYGIYRNEVINAVLSMRDSIRYFPTMIQWVGFKKISIPVQHAFRENGKSSYSWNKLIRLAINNILAFSDKPLRLTVKIGFYISVFSIVVGVYYLINYLSGNIEVTGFTTLILSIWFLSGIIITILGMLGLYIGKIYDKVKERPLYIVKQYLNINDDL